MSTQVPSDSDQVPDLTFRVQKDDQLDRYIWQRVAWLLMEDQEEEAAALLQEFELLLPWEQDQLV